MPPVSAPTSTSPLSLYAALGLLREPPASVPPLPAPTPERSSCFSLSLVLTTAGGSKPSPPCRCLPPSSVFSLLSLAVAAGLYPLPVPVTAFAPLARRPRFKPPRRLALPTPFPHCRFRQPGRCHGMKPTRSPTRRHQTNAVHAARTCPAA